MPDLVQYIGTRKLRWRFLYVVRFVFHLFGGDWNRFYSSLLDFQDRRVTLNQILAKPSNPKKFKGLWDWGRGRYHLEFMKQHGLLPNHSVLDVGCGYGRVTIPLLQYQQAPAHYIGTEISQRRLALAKQWISREGLDEKSFELVLSRDNRLPFICDSSIDVAWVLSVFNHMPDKELDVLLEAIARVLKPGGLLFCYYLVDTHGSEKSVKTFHRSDADMERRLVRNSFSCCRLMDWDSDISASPDARMLLATKETA